MSLVYVDTSALLKLIVDQPESEAMESYYRATLDGGNEPVTSVITQVELNRVRIRNDLGHFGDRFDVQLLEQVLDTVRLIKVTDEIVEEASRITFHVKTLDALHLGTASLLTDDLIALATYDDNMTRVGGLMGLECVAPDRSSD